MGKLMTVLIAALAAAVPSYASEASQPASAPAGQLELSIFVNEGKKETLLTSVTTYSLLGDSAPVSVERTQSYLMARHKAGSKEVIVPDTATEGVNVVFTPSPGNAKVVVDIADKPYLDLNSKDAILTQQTHKAVLILPPGETIKKIDVGSKVFKLKMNYTPPASLL